MKPALTASIVTYRDKPEVLRKAITSFLSWPEAGTLYVIDNSPTDYLKALCHDPRIQYRFNGQNLGFGRAHNMALREVVDQSTYHLIMNPDVYFEGGVLPALVRFMEQDEGVGLCMPKVLYPDGSLQTVCKLLPTPLHLITRRFLSFYPRLVNKLNYEYEMRFTGYDHVMEAPFLSGCFMFLRTSALKKVGFFDERYFLYAEDTDLSRAINRSFKTMFYPFAEIYHEHGRGSYEDFRLLIHNIRSVIRYFNKWGWIRDAHRQVTNINILKSYRVNGYARLKDHGRA